VDAKEQYILAKKIRLLYLNSLTPAILSGVIGICLVATLWQSVNHIALLTWLCITISLSLLRVCLMIAFENRAVNGSQTLKWEAPYAISLFAVVVNWSIGLLIILPNDNINVLFIVSIFSIGLGSASTSWYRKIRYLQMGTVCLFFMPIIISLLTYNAHETFWLGITACFMFFGCLSTSHLSQKILTDHFELAYELRKSIKKTRILAHTDVLTGLNNRRAFFEMAPKILTTCQIHALPVCLVTFDIDYFKKINDAYGHIAGDIALQRIASLLIKNLRSSDVCCRLGGEEFAMLLPNLNLKKAMHTAETLRKIIAGMSIALPLQNHIAITASFGVSDIGDTIDELLNHADQAMYKAKNSGRNLVLAYTPELSARSNQIKTRKNLRL
jgi:diguanylate cyclase